MNSKQFRKNRRFVIRKFINLMDVFDSQVTDWENNEHLSKDKIISEIRTIIRESKDLKK